MKIVLQNLQRKWIIFLPAIIYLAVAGTIKADYGLPWDEPTEMNTGNLVYNYVVNNDTTYLQHNDRDYGVFFQFSLTAITKLLNPKNIYETTQIRRTILIFVFTVFLVSLSQFIYSQSKSISLSLLGGLFILASPRIIAHSIFNTKDISFLCFYFFGFIAISRYIQNPRYYNTLIMSIAVGVAIDTRIIALELVPIALGAIVFSFISNKIKGKDIILHSVIYLIVTSITVYAFRPVLWNDPLTIIDIFQNMSKFRWDFNLVYFGQDVSAQNLPWHYLPVWIVISTPLAIIIPSLLSLFAFLLLIIGEGKKALTTKRFLWATAFVIPVGTVLTIIINRSVVYDGWRHIYFTYPFLILSLIFLLIHVKKYISPKYVTIAFTICLIPSVYLQSANHPHQQAYFNRLIAGKAFMNFEMDYWGAGRHEIIERLLNSEVNNIPKIHFWLGSSENAVRYYNDAHQQKLIEYTPLIDQADYRVHTVRWYATFENDHFIAVDTCWAFGNPTIILYKRESHNIK